MWKQYLEELGEKELDEQGDEITQLEINKTTTILTINAEGVQTAINKLKTRKVPGQDETTSEM